MPGEQHLAEDLVRLDQVVQVGARIVAAGRAVAVRIERRVVLGEAGVLQVDRPVPGPGLAVTPGASRQDGAASFGSTLTANGFAYLGNGATINGGTEIDGDILSTGLLGFYTASEDIGGSTGIVGNPNGWTRIDPNGQRFIITPSAEQVSAGANLFDIEDTDCNHRM